MMTEESTMYLSNKARNYQGFFSLDEYVYYCILISVNYATLVLHAVFVVLLDLIFYVPSTIFQLYRDRSSWVEPVIS